MTTPLLPLLVVAGVLGLAVGSFLNVVIHRVPQGASVIRPASHCPGCDTPIKGRHNVPLLSWLVLRGRCHSCSGAISARYPVVEVLTAALFVLMTARFGAGPELPAYLYLAAITVALAMIDLDTQRLPDRIVLPSYLVAATLLAPAVFAGGDLSGGLRTVLAAAALFAGFYVLWFFSGGIGFGDVKLAGVLGLYLGWLGWADVLVGVAAAFLLASVVGVALMIARRAGRKTRIPFGPALLTGAVLALFVSAPVADWYVSLTGLSA